MKYYLLDIPTRGYEEFNLESELIEALTGKNTQITSVGHRG